MLFDRCLPFFALAEADAQESVEALLALSTPSPGALDIPGAPMASPEPAIALPSPAAAAPVTDFQTPVQAAPMTATPHHVATEHAGDRDAAPTHASKRSFGLHAALLQFVQHMSGPNICHFICRHSTVCSSATPEGV